MPNPILKKLLTHLKVSSSNAKTYKNQKKTLEHLLSVNFELLFQRNTYLSERPFQKAEIYKNRKKILVYVSRGK